MFLYSFVWLPLMIVTHDGVSVMLVLIFSCSGTRLQSRAPFFSPFVMSLLCLLTVDTFRVHFPFSRPFTRALTVLYTLSPSSPAPHITHIPVHRYTYTPEVDHNIWFRLFGCSLIPQRIEQNDRLGRSLHVGNSRSP